MERKKYEFTGETKEVAGRKLRQIRALVAIGHIAAGTIGGWIEDEGNLAQVSGDAQVSGNAWVYDNAQVSGNAQVYDNAQVYGNAWVYGDASKTPIIVSGLCYPVTITDYHIRIGCEFHHISDWRTFDDRQIASMDGAASSRFWRDHKTIIIGLCDAHGRSEAAQ